MFIARILPVLHAAIDGRYYPRDGIFCNFVGLWIASRRPLDIRWQVEIPGAATCFLGSDGRCHRRSATAGRWTFDFANRFEYPQAYRLHWSC